MGLVTVTAPTLTPVTLSEAREQCRILDDTHDSLLVRLINAATSSIETLTGARLMTQTVRLDVDGFTSNSIGLGVYPVSAITAFVYDDGDDAEQSLVEDTDYWASLDGMYPIVKPVEAWPATKFGKLDSVRITMTVGYSAATVVPPDIRHAILLRIKEYFDNAGESVTGVTTSPTVSGVNELTAQHRRFPV